MAKVWSSPPTSQQQRKGRWMMPSVEYRLAIKLPHCKHRSSSIVTVFYTNANHQRVPERSACCTICSAGPREPRGHQLAPKSFLPRVLFIYSGEFRSHASYAEIALKVIFLGIWPIVPLNAFICDLSGPDKLLRRTPFHLLHALGTFNVTYCHYLVIFSIQFK